MRRTSVCSPQFPSSFIFPRLTNRSGSVPSTSIDYSDPPEIDPERQFEEEEDRLHPQDWSKTTAPHESYGAKEGRKLSSVFHKIDHDVKRLVKEKRAGSGSERRGSILSTWVAGKDKEGRDILSHGFEDEHEHAVDDDGDGLSGLTKVVSKTGSNDGVFENREGFEHRKTGSKGADRRGSILSVWKGGKDADGNHILHHDDEEWKV
jgi:hypothetical protein